MFRFLCIVLLLLCCIGEGIAVVIALHNQIWFNPISLIISALSLFVGLPSLLSLVPSKRSSRNKRHTNMASLLIEADAELAGEVVYVLPTDYWYGMLAPERNPATHIQYIELYTSGSTRTYRTVFKDLYPDIQYMCWGSRHRAVPITLMVGQIRVVRFTRNGQVLPLIGSVKRI